MSFQIIAITNRALCAESLATRVATLCDTGVDRVIVREKDLDEASYEQLLEEIYGALAPDQREKITVNTFTRAARKAGLSSVQVPLNKLQDQPELTREFATVGVSVHRADEAVTASRLGAQYCIAGHIFPTQCKAGLAPRGLAFLREVCAAVTIPVYAIGGINEANIGAVQEAGAAGACIMSGLMTCADPAETLRRLRQNLS